MSEAPRRKLNLFDATLLVMGGIIGVGIFFTPGGVARQVPQVGPYLSMWILGGVVAMCGALTFAHLGSLFPRAGGWFVYLREAYGPFVSFLFAWIALLVVSTGALAVMTEFCASSILAAVQVEDSAALRWALEIGIVTVVTGLALSGAKTSAWIQNGFMLVKLGAMLAFVIAGFVAVQGDVAPVAEAGAAPVAPPEGLFRAMIGAALPVLFAFGGWQLLGYTAAEVKEPARTLPRAIVLGIGGVVVAYLLLNLAFLRTLGIEGLARHGSDFASEAARIALGSGGGPILSAAMAVSAFGVVIVTVLATPWLYVAMARDGIFFESFGRLHARTNAPTLGLSLQLAITLTYLITLDQEVIDVLTGSVVFAEWIFHGLTGLSIWVFVRKQVGEKRPLALVAGFAYFGFALLVVFGTLADATWEKVGIGLVVISIGAVVYWPWRRWMERRA